MEIQRLVGAGSSGRSGKFWELTTSKMPFQCYVFGHILCMNWPRLHYHRMHERSFRIIPSRNNLQLWRKKRKKNCLAMHMAVCVHNNSLIPIGSFPHLVSWPAGKWRGPGTSSQVIDLRSWDTKWYTWLNVSFYLTLYLHTLKNYLQS